MQKEETTEIIERLQKQRSNKLKFLIIIFSILGIIIFLVLLISAYFYFKSPEKTLSLGANIEEALISEDGKTSYLKLAGGINKGNITKIKFTFKDKEGKEFIYETSEGVKEIEVPYSQSFWDWLLGKQFEGKYDYKIDVNEINLDNFDDIDEVSVVFEYKTETGETIETEILDTEKPKTQKPVTSSRGSSGGGSPGCTPDKDCSYYYDLGRCDFVLSDGCSDSLNCLDCNEGFYCYTEEGISNVCINNSLTCHDSDNEKDYYVKGNVTVCVGFGTGGGCSPYSFDTCSNNNLTEYYCHYNGSNFEIRNESYECKNVCEDGSCVIECQDHTDCDNLDELPCIDYICNNETSRCIINDTNGISCDDNLFCTINDVCFLGSCNGSLRNCSDNIDCTVDSCNEDTDLCNNIPDNSLCESYEYCNTNLGCVQGECASCEDCDTWFPFDCDYEKCHSECDLGDGCYYQGILGESCIELDYSCNNFIDSCEDYSQWECEDNLCELAGGCEWDGSCQEVVVCGNGVCEAGENCPQDAISCSDNLCYEPICNNGCGQIAVSQRQNDESCVSPLMCDGAGSCVECIDEGDCGSGESCVGGNCVVISAECTKYVDDCGTSGGSGTLADPYCRQGNDILNLGQLGDVICLQDGYYGEINTGAAHNSDYITIQAQPGHNPGFRRIRLTSGSKWIFRGLTISPELAPTYNPTTFVYIGSGCNNIIIEDCNMYSVQDASAWTINNWFSWRDSVRYAIEIQGPNTVVRNNTLKNVYFGIVVPVDSGDNVLIEHNTIEHFACDGIVISCDNSIIQHNIIRNSYKIDGCHCDGTQFHRGDDKTTPIYNTTIIGNKVIHRDSNVYDNNLSKIGMFSGIVNYDSPPINWLVENNVIIISEYNGLTFHGITDSIIINNIVFDPTGTYNTWIGTGNFGVNTVVRNNMANAYTIGGTNITADHNIDIDNYDPDVLFVDYQHGDLRHKENSPAIDAGSADLAPDVDILGTARPQDGDNSGTAEFDIGAYEYIPGTFVSECGNEIRETGELCDGINLGGETCQSQGFGSGNLSCFANCSDFDTSGCINECAGTDTSCGTYSNCSNCNDLNGCYANEHRDYYCVDNTNGCGYNIDTIEESDMNGNCNDGKDNDCDGLTDNDPECETSSFPEDYISYWKFNIDGRDEKGVNNGSLQGDAAIISNVERGNVLSLDGDNDYVDLPDTMNGMTSAKGAISVWIKPYEIDSIRDYIFSNHDISSWTNRIYFGVGNNSKIMVVFGSMPWTYVSSISTNT